LSADATSNARQAASAEKFVNCVQTTGVGTMGAVATQVRQDAKDASAAASQVGQARQGVNQTVSGLKQAAPEKVAQGDRRTAQAKAALGAPANIAAAGSDTQASALRPKANPNRFDSVALRQVGQYETRQYTQMARNVDQAAGSGKGAQNQIASARVQRDGLLAMAQQRGGLTSAYADYQSALVQQQGIAARLDRTSTASPNVELLSGRRVSNRQVVLRDADIKWQTGSATGTVRTYAGLNLPDQYNPAANVSPYTAAGRLNPAVQATGNGRWTIDPAAAPSLPGGARVQSMQVTADGEGGYVTRYTVQGGTVSKSFEARMNDTQATAWRARAGSDDVLGRADYQFGQRSQTIGAGVTALNEDVAIATAGAPASGVGPSPVMKELQAQEARTTARNAVIADLLRGSAADNAGRMVNAASYQRAGAQGDYAIGMRAVRNDGQRVGMTRLQGDVLAQRETALTQQRDAATWQADTLAFDAGHPLSGGHFLDALQTQRQAMAVDQWSRDHDAATVSTQGVNVTSEVGARRAVTDLLTFRDANGMNVLPSRAEVDVAVKGLKDQADLGQGLRLTARPVLLDAGPSRGASVLFGVGAGDQTKFVGANGLEYDDADAYARQGFTEARQDYGWGRAFLDFAGGVAEAAGGAALTAISAGGEVASGGLATPLAVAGGVGGVAAMADGSQRAVHAVMDRSRGRVTEGYITQAMQKAGADVETARRVDAGVAVGGMLPGFIGGGAVIRGGTATASRVAAGAAGDVAAANTVSAGVRGGGALSAGTGRRAFAAMNYGIMADQMVAGGTYAATGREYTPLTMQALQGLGLSQTQAGYAMFGLGMGPAAGRAVQYGLSKRAGTVRGLLGSSAGAVAAVPLAHAANGAGAWPLVGAGVVGAVGGHAVVRTIWNARQRRAEPARQAMAASERQAIVAEYAADRGAVSQLREKVLNGASREEWTPKVDELVGQARTKNASRTDRQLAAFRKALVETLEADTQSRAAEVDGVGKTLQLDKADHDALAQSWTVLREDPAANDAVDNLIAARADRATPWLNRDQVNSWSRNSQDAYTQLRGQMDQVNYATDIKRLAQSIGSSPRNGLTVAEAKQQLESAAMNGSLPQEMEAIAASPIGPTRWRRASERNAYQSGLRNAVRGKTKPVDPSVDQLVGSVAEARKRLNAALLSDDPAQQLPEPVRDALASGLKKADARVSPLISNEHPLPRDFVTTEAEAAWKAMPNDQRTRIADDYAKVREAVEQYQGISHRGEFLREKALVAALSTVPPALAMHYFMGPAGVEAANAMAFGLRSSLLMAKPFAASRVARNLDALDAALRPREGQPVSEAAVTAAAERLDRQLQSRTRKPIFNVPLPERLSGNRWAPALPSRASWYGVSKQNQDLYGQQLATIRDSTKSLDERQKAVATLKAKMQVFNAGTGMATWDYALKNLTYGVNLATLQHAARNPDLVNGIDLLDWSSIGSAGRNVGALGFGGGNALLLVNNASTWRDAMLGSRPWMSDAFRTGWQKMGLGVLYPVAAAGGTTASVTQAVAAGQRGDWFGASAHAATALAQVGIGSYAARMAWGTTRPSLNALYGREAASGLGASVFLSNLPRNAETIALGATGAAAGAIGLAAWLRPSNDETATQTSSGSPTPLPLPATSTAPTSAPTEAGGSKSPTADATSTAAATPTGGPSLARSAEERGVG